MNDNSLMGIGCLEDARSRYNHGNGGGRTASAASSSSFIRAQDPAFAYNNTQSSSGPIPSSAASPMINATNFPSIPHNKLYSEATSNYGIMASQHLLPPQVPPPPPPPPSYLMPTASDTSSTCPSQSLSSYHQEQQDLYQPPNGNNTTGSTPTSPTVVVVESADVQTMTVEAQRARDRAMEILQRFQQSSSLARDRQACLQNFEKRKKLALWKNLEHVARQEDERLLEKLSQCQQTQQYHRQMEDYHSQVLQLRKDQKQKSTPTTTSNNINKNTSKSSLRSPRPKRKNPSEYSVSATIALYVSNLPLQSTTKNNNDDDDDLEELLRALFGAYGPLRKIHFYTDKQTSRRKGDALVIYTCTDDIGRRRQDWLENVCTQMNGAELPCGTVLQVEPSDPLYQLRKKKTKQDQQQQQPNKDDEHNHHYGPSGTNTPQEVSFSRHQDQEPPSQDEDLDGFFGSLEKGEEEKDKDPQTHAPAKSENPPPEEEKDDDDDLDQFFEELENES